MDAQVVDGKTAIVTGAANGIGCAIASKLAKEGASVIVADVDETSGRETTERITAEGGRASFVRTDVTDTESVRSLIDDTVEHEDSVDILVNNAGGALDDDVVHEVDDETWRRNIELNLTGPFICTREVLPAMAESGGGRIVHVSSVNGKTGIGLSAYSAAKSGIHSLSRLVATQYGQYGIRSNVVCPGTIETDSRREQRAADWSTETRNQLLDQYPLEQFGHPEDVANAVLFLSSDLSKFVTGTEMLVDGGLTGGLDRTFERTVYDVDRLW